MTPRAPLWHRITDRLNAMVWALPVPRRVKVRLSLIIYRDPPTDADRVVEALDALSAAGVEAPVIGGWGVDALVGDQRRTHRDLDLIVDHRQVSAALRVLAGLGYEEWYREDSPVPLGGIEVLGDVIVVRDRALRVVELHPVQLDALDSALVQGAIGPRPVTCLSAEQQIRAHNGYRNRSRRDRKNHQANLDGAKLAHGPGKAGPSG